MLLKVTSMNAVGVLVRIVAGFITQKAIAVFVGPQGMGVVGNFRDFLAAIQSVSTLGITNGIVKYVAEFKKETNKLSQVLSTSLILIIGASSVSAVVIFFTASYWNSSIFGEKYDFTTIIQVCALAIPIYALNFLLVAIINGYSKYKEFIGINIVSNIAGVVVTVVLMWQFHLEGAIYAVLVAPLLAFVVTIGFIYKKRGKLQLFSLENGKVDSLKKLSSYAIMALLSTLALPVVRIAIRDYIAEIEDEVAVGYWEAMNRLSNFYLMFITTLMTLYVLPKLSGINSNKGFRIEVANFYKTILPLFAAGLLLVYFLRNFVINVLLTTQFAPMEPLFVWQLSGDLFKVASMVIAYQFLAKNMFWYYVISEIISLAIIYASSIFLISRYGFVGASMAHLFSFVLYFFMVVFILRKKLFSKET
ncbi:MAG: O-antigen translocase [Flavobacteriaceae bacterium CG2_30_34_30]|nr:MAG: O-antigen translocase [Flavobacteriaceae bacterium CG2_30_34_30]